MEKIDVEMKLLSGQSVLIPLTGTSMCPLFVGGRDLLHIALIPIEYKFKRLDIILYRRKDSILVLHRVYKVRKEGLYMVGDNQTEIEGPLPYSQVRGIMTEAIRKGKKITVRDFPYKLYSWFWMLVRPLRPQLQNTFFLLRKCSRKFLAKK